jgi:hypothetical protein
MAIDYTYGHGTHVVGSIVGQRSDDPINPTAGMTDGVAPEGEYHLETILSNEA